MRCILYSLLPILIFHSYNLCAIDKYFVTAANDTYFDHLLNLIGSIHETNFKDTKQIAVFNLGLSNDHIQKLNKIQKVCIYEIQKIHPDIIKPVYVNNRKIVPGWYAWKPVAIKQALDRFPYILWVDAGTTILKPLDALFAHIKEEGYLLGTIGEIYENNIIKHTINSQTTHYIKNKFNLNLPENEWILSEPAIMSCIIGVANHAKKKFIQPMYELSKDLTNYTDDGSCPEGFGAARHDQALLGVLGYLNNLSVTIQDATQENPIYIIDENNDIVPLYITWEIKFVCSKTHIFSSRNILNLDYYLPKIQYKGI